jgi:hypothetical protein
MKQKFNYLLHILSSEKIYSNTKLSEKWPKFVVNGPNFGKKLAGETR